MCSEFGCSNPLRARGLCNTHYEVGRLKNALPELKPKPTPEERFWSKVLKGDGCWEWTASKTLGYGRFRLSGRTEMAHRIAFMWAVGEIPEGLVVDHVCFNRGCVNPAHLQLSTREDNARRHPPECECSAHNPDAYKERYETCPNGHLKSEVGVTSTGGCLICTRKVKRDHMRRVRAKKV